MSHVAPLGYERDGAGEEPTTVFLKSELPVPGMACVCVVRMAARVRLGGGWHWPEGPGSGAGSEVLRCRSFDGRVFQRPGCYPGVVRVPEPKR